MKKIVKPLTAMILSASLALTPMPVSEQYKAVVSAAETRAVVNHVAVHDPSIMYARDKNYYIFGSHQAAASSADMLQWKTSNNLYARPAAEELAESFAWAGYQDGSTNAGSGIALWAPCAIYNPYYKNNNGSQGSYMIYYPASSNFKRGCIGYAVSQSPAQNYQYVNTIMYSGFTKKGGKDEQQCKDFVDTSYTKTNLAKLIQDKKLEFNDDWLTSEGDYNIGTYPQAIDPTVFFDKEDKLWMCYGSHGGGIWLLPLDRTTGMPEFLTKEQVNEAQKQGQTADPYFGYKLSTAGEAPFIFYDSVSGYYYLTVSYGQITDGYNIRLFRSKTVTGDYEDAAGRKAVYGEKDNVSQDDVGIKMIGNYQFDSTDAYCMAGHNSMIAAENGLFQVYHQRFAGNTAYSTRVHQMFRNKKGWLCTAVYEYAGDKIQENGYRKEELIGSYQFVNHGTISSGSQLPTYVISLNADGTITGDFDGTWLVEDGTYYMSCRINNITYDGVFFRQQDESDIGHNLMTFTAVGENNETIWGSKLDIEQELKQPAKDSQRPAYAYDFTTKDQYIVGNSGSMVGAGVLTGKAAIVEDEQMGLSLFTEDENSYLKVSSDSLYGMTEGFSIALWAKKENEGKGTLFSAVSPLGSIAITADWTGEGTISAELIVGDESAQILIDDIALEQWNYIGLTVSKDSMGISVNGKKCKENNDLSDLLSVILKEQNLQKQQITFGGGKTAIDNIEIYATPLTSEDYANKFDTDNAWTTDWQIDFGPEGSPQWDTFTMMYNTTSYTEGLVTQSYGFTEVIDAYETEAGGNKIRDFVYKAGGGEYTFKIDLPNGTYSVFVYSGNKMTENTLNFYFNDDFDDIYTQVTPEGVASDNYGGENTYKVTVKNNVLSITFWGDQSLGNDAVTGALNSLEIKKVESSDKQEAEKEDSKKEDTIITIKKPVITESSRIGQTNQYQIKWKKSKKADGYTLQISDKKSFKKIVHKTKVKTSSYIVKKKSLGNSKKVFLRVRAYTMIDGEKIYSKWSKGKKMIIK